MKENILINRYAEAFMAFARETIGLSKAILDFKNLKIVLFDQPEFEHFLKSPEITLAEKLNFVDHVLSKGFSEELKHFIKLLIAKRRVELIVDIADYIKLHYAHGEAVEALLKSSYPIDLDLMEDLKKKLEKKLQKKINFYLELDGGLKGGVQIMIGHRIIDGSVRKRLFDLREKLNEVRIC